MITASPMPFDTTSKDLLQRVSTPGNLPSAKRIRSWMLDSAQGILLKGWRGHAWVTMEGDPCDHLLGPGMEIQFFGPGLLVAEALDVTTLFDWTLES